MSARIGSRNGEGPVLVIDDDEIALQSIADLLTAAGYEVHALVSPIGATQVIATRGIIAAVIDLNMPVMRGDRFISLIRSWDKIRDLPVVLVSGESTDTVREVGARLPDVAVVTKAQMGTKLVPTLRRVLGMRPTPSLRGSLPSSWSAAAQPAAAPRKAQSGPNLQTRSLPRLAGIALGAWQGLASSAPLGPMMSSLLALQREADLAGLPQLVGLVELARHVLERAPLKADVSVEADGAVTELLQLFAHSSLEKCQSFERSLSLPLLRAKLERARQLRS